MAPSLGAFAAVLPLISAADESEKKGTSVTAGDMSVRVERLLHLVPLYATAFIGKIASGAIHKGRPHGEGGALKQTSLMNAIKN